MKKILFVLLCSSAAFTSMAQDESSGGFKKQNLFTGGGIRASFSNYTTVLGASPIFGYSINKYLDAGVLFNYNYSSDRHVIYNDQYGNYIVSDDKLRQATYGPGAFVKIYPVKFLFIQAQFEENFIKQKFIPADGSGDQIAKVNAGSFLVGAGYCSGRQGVGNLFYYVSLVFDVAKNPNSPYVEQTQSGSVNVLPIVSAGLQIPLFGGNRDNHEGGRVRHRRY